MCLRLGLILLSLAACAPPADVPLPAQIAGSRPALVPIDSILATAATTQEPGFVLEARAAALQARADALRDLQ
jgi:hypothetical protein